MKGFLWMLLFSRVVTLTPVPIDIMELHVIRPSTPLTAINELAVISIDVSHVIPGRDYRANGVKARELFPPNTVSVELRRQGGPAVHLSYTDPSIGSDGTVRLTLGSLVGVPTGVAFGEVIIRTQRPLKGVVVKWQNGRW